MKKVFKIIVDVLMYADFILLMNHGVIRNLTLHGISGIVLFSLFIIHHILNGWFYKSVMKGNWNAKRIAVYVTDIILFALMILMAVSSVMMSSLVFVWSPVHTNQTWRVIHLMSTSWGFIVMSFHLALHTDSLLKKIENRCGRFQKIVFYIFIILIVAAGIYGFIKSQLYIFMFNVSGWKMAAPDIAVGFLEYIGITAAVCGLFRLAGLLKSILQKSSKIK